VLSLVPKIASKLPEAWRATPWPAAFFEAHEEAV
jgi:hypothetical protein